MKIVTPLTNVECYEPLVKAGADEFFCGFVPYEWLKEYKNIMPINRRSYLFTYNICTLSSMKILSKLVEKYNVPIKITFNSLYYNEKQYPLILKIMKELIKMNFNTFIIADPALIIFLRKSEIDCKIHLSGEIGALNSLSVQFFNKFNISRYIFSRKTDIKEMEKIIYNNDNKDTEYEAFILNELCPYTGGYCNSFHCDELNMICSISSKLYRTNKNSSKFNYVEKFYTKYNKFKSNGIAQNRDVTDEYSYKFGTSGCGVCKIKKLKDIGVTHLKIVGRGKLLQYLISDVKNVRQIIDISENEQDYDKFMHDVKSKYFGNRCPDNCYYL